METSLLKTPSFNNVPNSHSPTFLSQNGIVSHLDVSDIEMVAIQAITYTSLKDLLPSSPPTIGSPTHNSSWHEIPIKNPLVKHAAIAYLQPMSKPPEARGKGLFRTMREKCRCTDGIGCLDWLRDVVWKSVREAFGYGRRDWDEDEDEDEDDNEDDDDEDCVKVD